MAQTRCTDLDAIGTSLYPQTVLSLWPGKGAHIWRSHRGLYIAQVQTQVRALLALVWRPCCLLPFCLSDISARDWVLPGWL